MFVKSSGTVSHAGQVRASLSEWKVGLAVPREPALTIVGGRTKAAGQGRPSPTYHFANCWARRIAESMLAELALPWPAMS